MTLTPSECYYLAICLEGFLFGIYSGIFAMHLQYHTFKKDDTAKQTIVFYALCVLYVFSMAVIAMSIAILIASLVPADTKFYRDITVKYHLRIAENTVFGCCDFIAQSILIHRCWIVWGRSMRVIIVPSILAFAYLAMWMAAIGSSYIEQNHIEQTVWGNRVILTCLVASMTVNALVTGLIVFRIFKVFRGVENVGSSEDKSLRIDGAGTTLRSIIFVIIESGMALFVVQLARVVVTSIQASTDAEIEAFDFIVSIHQMLNGITPTIILVRVSLGLSFHNLKESLDEAVSSLHFAADGPNAIPSTGINEDGSWHLGHGDNSEIDEEERRRR